MSAVSPITRQTVGRTFIVAISALGVAAAAQVAVIGWFFLARLHQRPAGEALSSSPPLTIQPRDFADPFDAGTSAPPAVAGAAAPPPKPVPVPMSQAALQAPADASDTDRFNEMVEQAKVLRERGDTYAAVTKLREAQTIDPQNPLAPSELAMTYEKMGFTDKAAEAWRRVYDMGDGAGVYFAAAEGRLKSAQQQALKQSTASAAVATPAPAPLPPPGETIGLSASSKLGLAEVTHHDETDPTSARKLILRVPVRAKPRVRLDVRDVIVQVQFYDMLNGKSLDRTNANVNYRWVSPPPDWSDEDVEVLEVTYLQPARHATDEERKFYGYLVTVYYKNALQDFRAEPANLAKLAPPPRMLTSEPTP